MRTVVAESRYFFGSLFGVMFRGGMVFYAWMTLLTVLAAAGILAYASQVISGFAVTNMREQVSWGFYISNFTFLVGVAAAAVLLVIPAYLYDFKPIKKIVAFGELLAVTAVLMAILFVFVDLGRPDRFWHMIPGLGSLNFPRSVLAWDMVVLNGYLGLNLFVAVYIGCRTYFGKEPDKRLVIPLILLSIPWAVGVHTVTAFVYNGMAARPFWNASILAPRFLASAFCSGPALMILVFQVLRRVMDFKIPDRAIHKLAEIIAYAMAINLFLLIAEVYKELYSNTIHLAPLRYLYTGLHGHTNLVPWIWTALVLNTIGFFIFLLPRTRKRLLTLNIGCVLVFLGIWIEKGLGLIIPGFIPDALGDIYEYMPSGVELWVSAGIWASGAMLYTLFTRAVIALDAGRLRHPSAPPVSHEAEVELRARDIMSRDVITVGLDSTVEEIGRVLTANRISGVPVVDGDSRIRGVVTESDIIFSEMHGEPHLMERLRGVISPETRRKRTEPGATAGEIMTSPVITAGEEMPVSELIRVLTDNRIKRVFIADHEGRPAGVVSMIDIVRALEEATRRPGGA